MGSDFNFPLGKFKIKTRLTRKVKFDLNSTSRCSRARESCETERRNLSIQSLNPASGHILTSLGEAEKVSMPYIV